MVLYILFLIIEFNLKNNMLFFESFENVKLIRNIFFKICFQKINYDSIKMQKEYLALMTMRQMFQKSVHIDLILQF